MLFLRDAFFTKPLRHGFRSTRQCGVLKHINRSFPVLDRSRSHLEQTRFPQFVCFLLRKTGNIVKFNLLDRRVKNIHDWRDQC